MPTTTKTKTFTTPISRYKTVQVKAMLVNSHMLIEVYDDELDLGMELYRQQADDDGLWRLASHIREHLEAFNEDLPTYYDFLKSVC